MSGRDFFAMGPAQQRQNLVWWVRVNGFRLWLGLVSC